MSTFVTTTLHDQRPDHTFTRNDSLAYSGQRIDTTMLRTTRLPLGSNNPFITASESVSPVSPLEPQQSQSSMVSEFRRPVVTGKSAGFQLDVEPSYEVSSPVRRVRVAKDMYNGQNPPQYEGPIARVAPVSQQNIAGRPSEQYVGCRGCGRRRTSAIDQTGNSYEEQTLEGCTRCGKRKTSMSLITSNIASSRVPSAPTGTVPTMTTQRSVVSPSDNVISPRPCCNNCGRNRYPNQTSFSSRDRFIPSNGTNTNVPQQPQPQPLQKAPSFGIGPIRQNYTALPRLQPGTFVEIDVTPPTASTSRPVNSPFPEDAPLLNGRAKKASKLSRSASIASAISRTFSRRKSKKTSSTVPPVPTVENPPPSQQPKHGRERITRIPADTTSHAIHNNKSQDHAKLNVEGTKIERPDSPFSFTDKPTEHEAFEMNDIRISKLDTKPEHEFLKDPYSAPLSTEANSLLQPVSRPEHLRSKSEAAVTTLTVPNQDDTYLANPHQRPTITRFKSLRAGVERAASVTRSTSLRRLNSIKKTPELWYRTDMAFEGAIGAY